MHISEPEHTLLGVYVTKLFASNTQMPSNASRNTPPTTRAVLLVIGISLLVTSIEKGVFVAVVTVSPLGGELLENVMADRVH